jgi:predicted glycoside hydrolase/deacetylase ChbG (UPF0249 family)
MTQTTERFLIVNADDFGAGRSINRGIIESHERGIVTSTSLLVDAPGTADAARLGRAATALGIGLHVRLTREGGVPLFDFDDSARCATEVTRQFERFVTLMGRLPTHLDTHHNVHRDARVLPHVLTLATHHGLPLREHSTARYVEEFYGQRDGVPQPEQISTASLVEMLGALNEGITELGCHPGYLDPECSTSYGLERELEVQTLCDPAVRQFLSDASIRLISFADIPHL